MCELVDNPMLKERTQKNADAVGAEIVEVENRLNFIEKELSVLNRAEHLDKAHIKSQIGRMDLIKDELSFSEKKEVIGICIKKLVLTLIERTNLYRREFMLTIVPTNEFVGHIGILEVLFTVDTSMGVSSWIITKPFKYECNFGNVREENPAPVIKKAADALYPRDHPLEKNERKNERSGNYFRA